MDLGSREGLIAQQREQYNWSLMFLGANIDAVEVRGRIGVPHITSLTYGTDGDGVSVAYMLAGREMVIRRPGREMAFTEADRQQAIFGASNEN